ncbi:hypothetical protein QWM81_28455 [Streptomyces ficellus]|uniref:Uncharacterized protein n=1 Tax=Streptomyces ficellus TaxID=1977088 RepID=A0ABT7ZEG6_9ACTN|nr:hypothetical protein [Streptomyces ficellus]MDN3297902.1 hypothetical protein [Streptomyces ficellus]
MHRPAQPGSPIYDQLVQEHGDVLNEARKLAELTHRQADRVLHWDLTSRGHEHHRGYGYSEQS